MLYALKKPPVGLKISSIDSRGRSCQRRGRQQIAVVDLLSVILEHGVYSENAKVWLMQFHEALAGQPYAPQTGSDVFVPRYLEQHLFEDELEENLRLMGLPYTWVGQHPEIVRAVRQVTREFNSDTLQ